MTAKPDTMSSPLADATPSEAARLIDLEAQLLALDERRVLQLSACDVAARSNTRASYPEMELDATSPAWSPAFECVRDMAAREIGLRERAEAAEAETADLKKHAVSLSEVLGEYGGRGTLYEAMRQIGRQKEAAEAQRDALQCERDSAVRQFQQSELDAQGLLAQLAEVTAKMQEAVTHARWAHSGRVCFNCAGAIDPDARCCLECRDANNSLLAENDALRAQVAQLARESKGHELLWKDCETCGQPITAPCQCQVAENKKLEAQLAEVRKREECWIEREAECCPEGQSFEETMAAMRARLAEVSTERDATWRCFHCDEVFIDKASAQEHFGVEIQPFMGEGGHMPPVACSVDVKVFRELEAANHKLEVENRRLDNDARLWHEAERERVRLIGHTAWWQELDSRDGERLVLKAQIAKLESEVVALRAQLAEVTQEQNDGNAGGSLNGPRLGQSPHSATGERGASQNIDTGGECVAVPLPLLRELFEMMKATRVGLHGTQWAQAKIQAVTQQLESLLGSIS